MADATRFQVKSKQIVEQKQATDVIATQMEKLTQSQAQIDELIQSHQRMEAMLSMLVSQSRGQTSHAPVLNSPPSGCLTASTTPPQPPDPPDFNQFGQRLSKFEFPVFDGTLLDCWIAKVDSFFEFEQYRNEEKLDLISLSVEGAALKWFRRHRREFTDWAHIKRKLMARFGSEKESTDSVEITSIKGHEVQGTTVSHLATSCVDNSVVENQKKLAWKDETPVFEHLHEPSRLFDDQSQAKLIQSQAKLIQSLENLETMMPRFFSQTSIPPRPPSQPPDPPDFNKSNLKFDGTLSELMSLKQCGDSVETYLEKFDCALSRLSVSMPYAVNIFLSNMNPHLASRVKQFDVTTMAYAAWLVKLFESSPLHTPAIQPRAPFSPYQNQNNQSHDNSPNTTSLLPPLETTKTLPYKPNFPTETNMEKSPQKLGMRGLCMSYDGSYANSHHLESKKSRVFVVECDDEESFGVREPSEVIVEEIVDKSVDMIQEEKSTLENESRPEVSPQILLSQFQVSLSSLEPGHRYQKESLVVVNDLSSNLGCVIGKTIGCNCDSEIGQDNSLDEEEFNRVWEPGGVFIEHDKWQGSEKCHELSIVVRLMQGLSSTRWSYGKVAELIQELQQPKTYLREIKLKELERSVTCSSVGCIVALLMVYDAERIQSDAPPIFSDLLCVKNRIQGRLKMVLLLEFLWLILFTSKMFKSSNAPQNKNQTDQKLSSYWKLLLSWKISQNIHVSSRCVLRQEERYVKVLELIKNRDSRKRKLCKNWWFKYKLNTWLSGVVHHTGFVKIIGTFSPMINEIQWDKETWVKLNPESCKGGSLLEFLKRHEARFDMIKVPNNTKFFNYLKFLVKSYTLRIEDALKGCKFVKLTMEQSEKPLITILSYEWFHSPRPPELSCCKEDEESTARIASLRTRMI